MKLFSGILPDNVVIVKGATKNITLGSQWQDKKFKTSLIVQPSLVIENNNQRSLTYAKNLFQNNYTVETWQNLPIKNIQICSVNYNQTYKIIANGLYLNAPADLITDGMLRSGLKKGGILEGEFIFAKVGQYLRLIKINSDLHKAIIELQERSKLKKIKSKELEVGSTYIDKRGNHFLYLGFVDTQALHYHYRKEYLTFDSHYVHKLYLSIAIPENNEKNISSLLKSIVQNEEKFLSICQLRASHSFILKVGQLKKFNNLIDKIRDAARQEIKNCIVEYAQTKDKNTYNAHNLSYDISYLSKFANMSKSGANNILTPFDYKKYLSFC